MKPLKLIIFDFFGTLAYFRKSDPHEFFSDLAHFGFQIKTEEEMKLFGQLFKKSSVLAKDWLDFTRIFVNGFSLEIDDEKTKQLSAFLKEKTGVYLFDDAKEVFGLPMKKAVLSTGARFLIEETIPRAFEVFSPDETKFIKPDPRSFSFVLEKMNVDAKDALMVGDEIERDLISAESLGMDTILIDRENKISNPSFKKIHSLKELKILLGL